MGIPALITICIIVVLSGCYGSSVKQQAPADVTSNPSGAEVYANGQKLGVTPLHYKLYKAFPARWQDMTYQAQGVLTVKMNGCEDYILCVNDYVLSQPVHVDLVCDEDGKQQVTTSAEQETDSPVIAPVNVPQMDIEKKLTELDALYEGGVITKKEYYEIRERILNKL